MKNKKLLLLLLLVIGLWLSAQQIAWASGIEFKPNIRIPGTTFDAPTVVIDNSSLGKYIVALYNYGSVFAGFVGMFMLVYAGYQWLFAAGRMDKIAQAKNTISGVLIGLGLLFGSYILMSQISVRLVNFGALDIQSIEIVPGMEQECKDAWMGITTCSEIVNTTTQAFGDISCVGQMCDNPDKSCTDNVFGGPCPKIINSFGNQVANCSCKFADCSKMTLNNCSDYEDAGSCRTNKCYGKATEDGSIFQQVCYFLDVACVDLEGVRCDSNSECDYDRSGTWCCTDAFIGRGQCKLRSQSTCVTD